MTEENKQPTSNEEEHLKQNREAQRAARAKRVEESRALLAKLSEEYPDIFPHPKDGRPVVLAIGLHKELVPIVQEWGFSGATLRSGLAWYTKQLRYQRALVHAKYRTNLDGSQAEEILDEHREVAKAAIEKIEQWLAKNRPEALKREEPKKRTPKGRNSSRPKAEKKSAKSAPKPKMSLDEKMQSLMEKFNQ